MENPKNKNLKKTISLEGISFLIIIFFLFSVFIYKMGTVNFINTVFNTSFKLLTETVLYLTAITVVTGGLIGILNEFGITAILNKLFSPFMRPLFGMPGAGVIGVITTYFSDNPAILALGKDPNFTRYFKKYQLPAIVNMGTGFGMGLIITLFMIGLKSPGGENFFIPVLIGNVAAIIGTIVSTRLMLAKAKKLYGKEKCSNNSKNFEYDILEYREVREGSISQRFLAAMLEGGASGIDVGVSIIPGVLIISTFVMLLTYGPGQNGYTGEAFQGIQLLPWIGNKLSFIINPLFGFNSAQNIAVPITALGASSASMSIIPSLLKQGLIKGNDIAVFTAMCMCLSGYLSTHVAMMNTMNFKELTGRAILSHTIGAIFAGTFAHILCLLIL